MRPGWGIGTVIAVLLAVAVGLLFSLSLQAIISLLLFMVGVWTVVAAFTVVDRKDRSYFSAWGAVIAAISLSYLVPLQYELALILLAVIAIIVVNLYIGRTPKVFEAATNPSPPAGTTPAAER